MRPVCLLMIFLLFTLLYLVIQLKINLLILLKEPSREKALLTLHVMTEMHFFFGKNLKKYHAWSCQNVCDALTFLLDNIFIRFGTKLYRQVVGIPMGTNCAPLVADLFQFCYERDFMMSLSDDKQADVIDAFNTTSRYLDDILNINNVCFDNMVSQIYPSELQLYKANTSLMIKHIFLSHSHTHYSFLKHHHLTNLVIPNPDDRTDFSQGGGYSHFLFICRLRSIIYPSAEKI